MFRYCVTSETSQEKRKNANRESARRSRIKRSIYIKFLENNSKLKNHQITDIQSLICEQITDEMLLLKSEIAKLKAENCKLKKMRVTKTIKTEIVEVSTETKTTQTEFENISLNELNNMWYSIG